MAVPDPLYLGWLEDNLRGLDVEVELPAEPYDAAKRLFAFLGVTWTVRPAARGRGGVARIPSDVVDASGAASQRGPHVKTSTYPAVQEQNRAIANGQQVVIRCDLCGGEPIFTGLLGESRAVVDEHRAQHHPDARERGTTTIDAALARAHDTLARPNANGGSAGLEALERMDAGEPQQPVANPSPAPSGKHTIESIVAAVKEYAAEHDGYAPAGSAPGFSGMSQAAARRFGVTWRQVAERAGVKPALTGRAVEKARKSSGSAVGEQAVTGAADEVSSSPTPLSAGTASTGEPSEAPKTPRDTRAPEPHEPQTDPATDLEPIPASQQREPIRLADIPYDADLLENEAAFLTARADALLDIARGVRKLADLSTPKEATP